MKTTFATPHWPTFFAIPLTTSKCLLARSLAASVIAITWAAEAQTLLIHDDFDNNDPLTPIEWGGPNGGGAQYGLLEEVDQQLVLRGNFPPINTESVASTFAAWIPPAHRLSDTGQGTVEVTVDVIAINENDAFAVVGMEPPGETRGYILFMDEDEIGLAKYGSGFGTAFFWEQHTMRTDNVTMKLSIAEDGSDLVIRTRVLDRQNSGQVLFDKTVRDTPGVDVTVPNRSIKGLLLDTDISQAPFSPFGGDARFYLAVWWVNPDAAPESGTAEVIFDNFAVYEYEPPTLAVEPAVRLSWPATPRNFRVEGAPIVDGPWQTVAEPVLEIDGVNYITVPAPASSQMRVFRLVE